MGGRFAAYFVLLAAVSCGGDRDAGAKGRSGDAGARTDGGPGSSPVPPVPVGYDAYRRWDRMYEPRIGTRTYMRSTYDRAGGNEAADASHFLRQDAEDRNVTLDVQGPGVLTFARTNHWHGSPWHYVVDSTDHLVAESSTADPLNPAPDSVFTPGVPFEEPLAYTWSATRGSDFSWVPVPFERTFTLAYGRTHYGTGYFVYQSFPEGGTDLSSPLESFTERPPPSDVVELLEEAGSDMAPSGDSATTSSRTLDVSAGVTVELARLEGPGVIRAITLHVPTAAALAASNARLRITWDGRVAPSVDAPLALFFGAGTLYSRDGAEWLVRGLLTHVRFVADEVELAAYFPMPYFQSAKLELVGDATDVSEIRSEVRTEPLPAGSVGAAYFHATHVDHVPVTGQDLVLLDTTETEGGGDFCGSFVGTSFSFSDHAVLTTLEGNPRFFLDDSLSPQGYGTGTEEWAGGGDYWGGRTMTLPLAGHPTGAPDPLSVKAPEDAIESAYRVLVADAMPFGKNARIQLEHGGTNESTEHYRTVTYWYGAPGACLVRSDSLDVGDEADEAAHRYVSPDASDPVAVSSRYEWGVDHVGVVETFPETSDSGRSTRGTTEFSVHLAPENVGVLLRRKLDYSLPDQRALVYVADDRSGATFERAGTWYLAGSNSAVFSNPWGELDPPAPLVTASNRRWREDEFLIRRGLTEGRSAVRIRIVPAPATHALLPGGEVAESAWSEFHYDVYSWVLPAPTALDSR